jgi:glycine oxidase
MAPGSPFSMSSVPLDRREKRGIVEKRISVIGAGVAGLTAAYEFVRAGCAVTIHERAAEPGRGCSFYAGGMIAPWCEAEASEPVVVELGLEALHYWRETVPVALRNGSLLVAPARDLPELGRFGRRTSHFEAIDADAIAALEPDLAGRFSRALYFAEEAHLDPRAAVAELRKRLEAAPLATFRFGTEVDEPEGDWIIDCRGYAARDRLPDLRGVKGEMVVLETRDIAFSRPIQLIHPRNPVYIVPRGDGRFMVGATMIENAERGRVRARALLDLIGAAYTVHPAFGEAEIVEIGCDLRPAFPDNLPRIRRHGHRLFINGLFRHGFLLAPALAVRARRMVLDGAHFPEVSDADPGQRKTA